MIKSVLKVFEDMIETGTQKYTGTFYNGCELTIKYTKSAKFRSKNKENGDYDTDIASEPCLKCGKYEFEQFDLILYHMKPLPTKQKEGS